MPTTLWFDDPADLQKLIACGEYSMCYNLIDYILRRYGQQKSKYPAWVRELLDRLVEDWKKFEVNPMMMAREIFWVKSEEWKWYLPLYGKQQSGTEYVEVLSRFESELNER